MATPRTPDSSLTTAIGHQLQIFSVLRFRDFRLFWSVLLVQVAGHMMMRFTFGWLAFHLTGSPLSLGYVALATAIPGILMRLAGGVFADRVDQRYVIVATQIISAVVIGGLAFLTVTGSVELWHLIAASFLSGAVQSFDDPSRSSLFPHLLPDRSHLVNAVPMFSIIWRVNQMVAPAMAGFLIAYAATGENEGAGPAFAVSAATFVVMAMVMPLLRVRGVQRARSGNALQSLAEGTQYVWRHDLFRVLVITNCFIAVFGVGFIMMLPVFAEEVFHVDATGLGILTSAGGVGSLGGVILTPILMRRFAEGKVIIGMMLAFGGFLLAFAVTPWFYVAMFLVGVLGLTSYAFLTAMEITVQTMVPDQLRGRVMSLMGLRFSLISLGTFLMGVVANFTDVRWAVGGGAVLIVVYAVIIGLSNRAIRSIGAPGSPAPQVAEAAKAEG